MYKIELGKSAAKDLGKIYRSDKTLYNRFLKAFENLAMDPLQGKSFHGKLKGLSSHRMGSYRIIYETYQHKLLVIILDLGHRKDIYQ